MSGAKLFRTMLLAGCFLLPHQIAVGDCCVYSYDDFDWVFPEEPYAEQWVTSPDGDEWYCHYDSEEDYEANSSRDEERITSSGDDDDEEESGLEKWDRDEDDFDTIDTDGIDTDYNRCRFGDC